MIRKKEIVILRKGQDSLSTKRSHVYQDVIVVLAVLFVFLLGHGIRDYYQVCRELSDKHRIEQKAARQAETIASQQAEIQTKNQHIENFSSQVNALKLKLIVLNRYEQEIRMVSNFINSNGHDQLFGVGGSPADNLYQEELTQDHYRLIREIYNQMDQLGPSLDDQKEGFDSLLRALNKQKDLLNATPSICPVKGRITSRYGDRLSPFDGRNVEFHEGLDIASPMDTPIRAAAHGTVKFAGWNGSYGKMLVIDHGYGTTTRYAHIGKILKKTGDKVKKGETIALVGNTGRSTGPHLHYEVCLNGRSVNPQEYIIHR
jgi:murein DD-endopeptidase MepM/ murein hydrolase activator NlpD